MVRAGKTAGMSTTRLGHCVSPARLVFAMWVVCARVSCVEQAGAIGWRCGYADGRNLDEQGACDGEKGGSRHPYPARTVPSSPLSRHFSHIEPSLNRQEKS